MVEENVCKKPWIKEPNILLPCHFSLVLGADDSLMESSSVRLVGWAFHIRYNCWVSISVDGGRKCFSPVRSQVKVQVNSCSKLEGVVPPCYGRMELSTEIPYKWRF